MQKKIKVEDIVERVKYERDVLTKEKYGFEVVKSIFFLRQTITCL